jgi:ATP-binding cassette subfamily F protein uup
MRRWKTSSAGGRWIEIGGKRTHVKSYFQPTYLFSPARITPVHTRATSEARLLLARLFCAPTRVGAETNHQRSGR